MNFSEAVWKKDEATQIWRERHTRELSSDIKTLDAKFLGDAMTYCEGYGNPFTKEILDRAGLFDEFAEAKTSIARSRILDSAGDKLGLMFF